MASRPIRVSGVVPAAGFGQIPAAVRVEVAASTGHSEPSDLDRKPGSTADAYAWLTRISTQEVRRNVGAAFR